VLSEFYISSQSRELIDPQLANCQENTFLDVTNPDRNSSSNIIFRKVGPFQTDPVLETLCILEMGFSTGGAPTPPLPEEPIRIQGGGARKPIDSIIFSVSMYTKLQILLSKSPT
jgi:hypothetical protein